MNSWMLLQSRFHDKSEANNKGILSEEKYTLEVNRLNADLLELILKIEESIKSNTNKLKNKDSFKPGFFGNKFAKMLRFKENMKTMVKSNAIKVSGEIVGINLF